MKLKIVKINIIQQHTGQAGVAGELVHGILAFAKQLSHTQVLCLVYEPPSPSLDAVWHPFDSSLYFSLTDIDPQISNVLLPTNYRDDELYPFDYASLTFA